MSKRIAFTVSGEVQGVFFRDFTQKKANSYGITGFVSNTSDGKVAGEAQGDDNALQKLKADLNKGPGQAHVVKVEVKDVAVKDGEKSFETA
ncbi:hypothetical protein H2200_007166 [Cladophialophora chaetospira]|uniref:acylphosphatase n=1 Tax=Cladophialophora chaetospira TaxID=386627 RepID=A0AA38X7G4_9EURO|nr:hypothetical protein H2200_007166 [Cladophialophora chaetospira]